MDGMCKVCKVCGRTLPYTAFNKDKSRADGRRNRCRECDAAYFQAKQRDPEWKKRHNQKSKDRRARLKSEDPAALWAYDAVANARQRAKRGGVPCNISLNYVRSLVVDYCPLLGIPLIYSADELRSNSATLDRKQPDKGYVEGNVAVLSHRANRLKSDSSIEELKLLLENLIIYMESA